MRKLLIAATVTSLAAIPASEAATVTGSLTVSATLAASCAVNTSTTGTTTTAVLNFGTVTSMKANIDASTSSTGGSKVTVLCSNGTGWTLAMNGGSNVSGTQRRMLGGNTEYVPYNLYSDSARTVAIGINTTALSGTGTGALQSYDIYGRIPAGSTLTTPGAYTDTVTMTLTY
ncbi:Csu type fimbrial protein [Tatumella sp. UBA2305]|uniref:Csu type fimbrial protein n=1 Tax=Tatumella sp. UBA2305 TaxID=1947647 RepID=UPI0025D664F5|nr:spore coat U domain-containing protein [Tatumella sp. UBA2305]